MGAAIASCCKSTAGAGVKGTAGEADGEDDNPVVLVVLVAGQRTAINPRAAAAGASRSPHTRHSPPPPHPPGSSHPPLPRRTPSPPSPPIPLASSVPHLPTRPP